MKSTDRQEIDENILKQLLSQDSTCLEAIVEYIPYYIFWKNVDSVYLGCNYRFARLVGKQSPKDIIGKKDVELNWGKDEADLYRVGDLETMRGNPKVNVEEKLIRPDGTVIFMLVSKVVLWDKENNCVGVLGISTDITERKKMEEELQQAKECAEVALKAKEAAEKLLREKSVDLSMVLEGMTKQKYYLTGKYKNIYLTKREAECVVCLARNMTAKDIAKILKLKPRTVEMFLTSAKNRLGCRTRAELIKAAIECRFLEGVRPVV